MRSAGFHLGLSKAAPASEENVREGGPWASGLVGALLTECVGLTAIGRVYQRAVSGDPEREFCARALDALGVRGSLSDEALTRIPSHGPLLVVANHPFGGIDGLLLLDLLVRVRPDVRLLANRMLGALGPLRDRLVLVDVFGGHQARRPNAAALRRAMAWLASGRCLALFPAGEVAHRLVGGRVTDSQWHPRTAEIALRAQAAVLPVFVEGQNGRLFRVAGAVHPLLRTALLPRELMKRRGSVVPIRVGEPIAPGALLAEPNAAARTQWLRSHVEALAGGARGRIAMSGGSAEAIRESGRRTTLPAVVARGPAAAIGADVERLPAAARLLESGRFEVLCARATQLPAVLPELGRLREEAFRLVGEGTGTACDVDRFDQTYQHLFVWDRAAREIAGAYRLGATDELTTREGVDGLYTRTLFEYDHRLVDALGPALELGRSFVHPGYQRDFAPLMLLWKGISRVVLRAPRYRRLFGVVSISDHYNSMSRQLLLQFLRTTHGDAHLSALVRAKHPPEAPHDQTVVTPRINRLDDVSARVRALEPDGKDVPILLKQYLRLNAKLLGFTIDPAFGNALDGLVVVDLATVEPAILARYMGRAQAHAFLAGFRRSVVSST